MIEDVEQLDLDQEETLMVLHDIFAAAIGEAVAQGVVLDLETLTGLSLKTLEDGGVSLVLEMDGTEPKEVKVSPEVIYEVLGVEDTEEEVQE